MIYQPKRLNYKESRRAFLAFVKDLECLHVITTKVEENFETVLQNVRSGVYIQLRDNGDIYIGEAVDIVQRQKQHITRGVVLKALAVIPFVTNDLELRFQFETDLIVKALERGLMLANDSKMRLAQDKLMEKAPERRELFKNDLDALSRKINSEMGDNGWLRQCKIARESMTEKDWETYHEFLGTPGTLDLTILVNRYIRRVLPEPETTYGSFWWLEVGCDQRSPYISMIVQTWTTALMKARILRKTGEMTVTLEGIGEMPPEEFVSAIDSGMVLTGQADLILKLTLTRQVTKRGDLGKLFVL